MTREQKKVNEKFFKQIMKFSSTWFWPDELESYDISDNKIICRTKKGYDSLCRIVTKSFVINHIEHPR